MRLKHVFIGLLFTSVVNAIAQVPDRNYYYVDKPYYARLVVPKRVELVIENSNIVIDTLIMDNKSSIRFPNRVTYLKVQHAKIGKRCTMNAAGVGEAPGGRGMNGRGLYITMTFETLGSLTIDTRGGTGRLGGNGSRGVDGRNGTLGEANGGPGGPGGNGAPGGDAGDLTFYYSCNGFTPSINEAGEHAIFFKNQGGFGGGGGPGGQGGRGGKATVTRQAVPTPVIEVNGTNGVSGPAGPMGTTGDRGRDGKLIVEKIHG